MKRIQKMLIAFTLVTTIFSPIAFAENDEVTNENVPSAVETTQNSKDVFPGKSEQPATNLDTIDTQTNQYTGEKVKDTNSAPKEPTKNQTQQTQPAPVKNTTDDSVNVSSEPVETVNNYFIGTFRLFDRTTGKTLDFLASRAFAYDYKQENPKLIVDQASLNIFLNEMDKYFAGKNSKKIMFASPIKNGKYKISEEIVPTRRIEREQFKQEMMRRIQTADYTLFELPFVDVTVAQVGQGANFGTEISMLSSYLTYYNASDRGRSYNIDITAEAINGTKLAPGEKFHFNSRVKSVDSKLKNAFIIKGDEFVLGLGGGQCQVSTTLFNTVLEAGLKIDHRRNHTLKIHYVPYGRDAMVSNTNDFVFSNNFDNDIYIFYRKAGNSIAFDIYGNPADKKVVKTWVTGLGNSYTLYRTIDGSQAQETFRSFYKD